MESVIKEDLIIVRMLPGEEMIDNLVRVCRKNNTGTAVILSSIGQLKDIELGYFVKKGDYSPDFFPEVHELLSLSGMITRQDGEYIPHIHAVLGNQSKEVIGGHLLSGTVQITNETVLMIRDIRINRTLNEETGLKDLDP